MSVVVFIIVLFTIILIHEMGHFGAAKLFKMNAYQFNLGMGPILWKRVHKGTQYALRAFPIGGSVVLGEDWEPTDDPKDFRNKPVWQRIIVIAAGATLNLILGLILCIVMFSIEPIPSVVVDEFWGTCKTCTANGELSKDCPECHGNYYVEANAVSNKGESGLKKNDKIVGVNGMGIISASEIFYKMDNSLVKKSKKSDEVTEYASFEFKVIRDGKRVNLPDVRFAAKENENGGVTFVRDFWVKEVDKNPLSVLEYSSRNAVSFGRIIWLTLGDIVNGTYGMNEVAGPVGMASSVGEVTKTSKSIGETAMILVRLSALITINLGIVNLLPIPALDGGRIIFLAVEGIRRKPLNPNVENSIHFVGFALLMLLMVAVTFNDIKNLIFGG